MKIYISKIMKIKYLKQLVVKYQILLIRIKQKNLIQKMVTIITNQVFPNYLRKYLKIIAQDPLFQNLEIQIILITRMKIR